MAALRRMLPHDRGVIVQVGSALAYRGIPLQAPYCAARHAIQGFTESLRCELLHERSSVHVTMVQLPALNTPQFEWGRSRMPRRPRPVPPIYQPEVAADAIVWAARHRSREVQVGGSTVMAILGEKLAPALGERYLARTAYAAQQSAEPAAAGWPDNLFEPVPGDRGAHGRFDSSSRGHSLQLGVTTRRRWLGTLAATALLTGAGRWKRGTPRRPQRSSGR